MREALMCTPVTPPPPDVSPAFADQDPNQPRTKRQMLEMHRTRPDCALCHELMDPLGLPLELFDAIGRYRTTERGLQIDPSGRFEEQTVADARQLGVAASASTTIANCILRKYYSYAMGHEERPADGSALNALATSFASSGYQLRDLILNVVTHEAFSAVAPQP
jgi:hypothetical protein